MSTDSDCSGMDRSVGDTQIGFGNQETRPTFVLKHFDLLAQQTEALQDRQEALELVGVVRG